MPTSHSTHRPPRPRLIPTILLALLTVLAASLTLTPSALAATYTVDACQHPDGTPTSHDGWTPLNSGAFTFYGDTCSSGGDLDTSWDSTMWHAEGSSSYWKFDAPLNTTLAGLSAFRTSAVGANQPSGSPEALLIGDSILERCANAVGCASLSGDVAVGLSGATSVRFGINCSGGSGCPAGGSTFMTLKRIQLHIYDNVAPVFVADSVSGTLASPSSVDRQRSLSYSVTDAGSGAYRQTLHIDDALVTSSIIDTNGGACATYSTYGSFSSRVPCKLQATGQLSLDTALTTDGAHNVTLDVFDATNDNHATRSWSILVDNLPPSVSGVAVSGTPRVGDRLTGSASVNGQSPAVQYQWLRGAADGSDPKPIVDATGASYVLTDEDAGHKVMLSVSATDHGGTTTRTSAPTDAPFTGKVVAEYCSERPVGPRDECGDFDGDGQRNRVDDDIDGDGTRNELDPDPYNAAIPASATSSGGPSVVNPKDPAAVAVANPVTTPGTNGSPADPMAVISVRFERGSGSRMRTTGRIVARLHERVRVRGTITTQKGKPIANARVFLAEKLANAGDTGWKINGGTVSREDGSLLLFTSQGGRSRDIRLVYFPEGGRDGNRASNPLSLLVRQDASLRLSRRSLRNGQTLWFRGVVGGQIAATGASVQLQVKLRTGWYTFRRLTTTRRAGGRFASPYRFRRTTTSTRYRFRVKVVPRNASSYAIGYSKTLAVTVRP